MTLGVCLHLWAQLPVMHQMHAGGAEAGSPSVVLVCVAGLSGTVSAGG